MARTSYSGIDILKHFRSEIDLYTRVINKARIIVNSRVSHAFLERSESFRADFGHNKQFSGSWLT